MQGKPNIRSQQLNICSKVTHYWLGQRSTGKINEINLLNGNVHEPHKTATGRVVSGARDHWNGMRNANRLINMSYPSVILACSQISEARARSKQHHHHRHIIVIHIWSAARIPGTYISCGTPHEWEQQDWCWHGAKVLRLPTISPLFYVRCVVLFNIVRVRRWRLIKTCIQTHAHACAALAHTRAQPHTRMMNVRACVRVWRVALVSRYLWWEICPAKRHTTLCGFAVVVACAICAYVFFMSPAPVRRRDATGARSVRVFVSWSPVESGGVGPPDIFLLIITNLCSNLTSPHLQS